MYARVLRGSLDCLRGKKKKAPRLDSNDGPLIPEMVSDVCELNIPEVKLFFRFCEHRDSDVLPVGMKFAKAIFSTSVRQFVIHN